MIKLLNKSVADKIAAGEVVDRPLSIVKELVENSIDAGASAITVEIRNGGKTYIRVTDNGEGIAGDEVLLAFMRHATSKISTSDDLDRIHTLGFRGEALASIAAVSRVELITKKRSDKLGTRVNIEGGEQLEKVSTGCPDGTTLVISDLFFNTPARLKFMKNDSSETSLIIDFVSKIALAYPAIAIRLISNGVNLFTTQGKGDRFHTILTVFNKELGENLIPMSEVEGTKRMEGYISTPAYSKTNRKHQIFFVNGRVISSKTIETGLEEAYYDKLFEGRFPIGFLFIEVDPGKVDVNIHPNKKEVRFDDDREIKDFISHGVRKRLNTKESIPEIKSTFNTDVPIFTKSGIDLPVFKKPEKFGKSTSAESQVDIKQLLSTLRAKEENLTRTGIEEVGSTSSILMKEENTLIYRPFDMKQLQLLGSIFQTYILATLEDSFYMIDQHAAHERIFYEKLMHQYKNSEKFTQHLLLPFVLDVSFAVKENALDWLEVLQETGYEIQEFGPKAYRISGIPAFMTFSEAQDFVNYFLENISEDVDLDNQKILDKIISNACKSAIKSGDSVSNEEIHALLAQLADCENPYSCPHGRPTFIKLTKYEIERMFKRT